MKIFAWQTDTGMCHMYRTQFPFEFLRDKAGYEVAWGAPPSLAELMSYDVIVGQRLTGFNGTWRMLSHDYNGLMVYDLDDDLIDVDPENTVPYSIYQPQRAETIANIQMADIVTVSTPKLAEKVSAYHPDVRVLENRLPASWFRPATIPASSRTVGWGGSPFHRQDFPAELTRQIHAVPNISLHTIGGHFIPGARRTNYQALETAMGHYDFAVGLAPLKDCHFNQSKSWCKAFEYAACGIPVVASDVGQYADWINQFNGGIAVPPGGSFTEAIETVLNYNQDFRTCALATASKNSMDNHWQAWDTVYSGAW